MPRTKKKMRIALPDGVTAQDVKQALAQMRNAGLAFHGTALDVAGAIALQRTGEVLKKLADENPPDAGSTLL
jgi:hypothetical protein